MIGNASMGASVSGSRRDSLGMTSMNMLTDQDRRGSININTNTSTSPSPTDRGRNSMIGNASMGASVSGSRRGSLGMTSVNMLTDQDRRGSVNINTNTSTSPAPTSISRTRTGASIGIDIDRASSILICQHIH